jgi:hypothetical protein
MLEYSSAERIDADMIFTIFSLFCLGGRKETALMVNKLYKWLKPNGILRLGTICAEDLRKTPEMYDCHELCANDVTMTFMGVGSRCLGKRDSRSSIRRWTCSFREDHRVLLLMMKSIISLWLVKRARG